MSGPDKYGPGREADIKQRKEDHHEQGEKHSEARKGGNVHRGVHFLLRKENAFKHGYTQTPAEDKEATADERAYDQAKYRNRPAVQERHDRWGMDRKK